MHPKALQHIASELPASFLAFTAYVWPTVTGCFAPRWPHYLQALAQSSESLSGLSLSEGLNGAIIRHFSPFWHDACRSLQW